MSDQATADTFFWIGGTLGTWDTVGAWQDLTTGSDPSTSFPAAGSDAIINGGTGFSNQVTVDGPGAAGTLDTTGYVTLGGGVINVGSLAQTAAGANLDITGTLSAGTATFSAGLVTVQNATNNAALLVGSSVIATTIYVEDGLAQFANATLVAGGNLDLLPLSGSGAIEIGTLGGAAADAITIDAGATLVDQGGGLQNDTGSAAIIVNGILLTGNLNVILETLTGSGLLETSAGDDFIVGPAGGQLTFDATAGAEITFDRAVAATDTILFGGTAAVVNLIGESPYSGTAAAAPIYGFAFNDSLLLGDSQALTSAVFTQIDASHGTLAFFNGSARVGTLTLEGSYAGDTFLLTTDGRDYQLNLTETGTYGLSSGTGTPTAYVWQGAPGGAFGDAGNWNIGGSATPATAAPGTLDSAIIVGGTGDAYLVVTGPASDAALEIDGEVVLDGSFSTSLLTTGTRAGQAQLFLGTADVLAAGTLVALAGNITATGTGAALSVTGPTSLGAADLAASGSAVITLGTMVTMAAGNLDGYSGGQIRIGTITPAASDEVGIGAGATLAGYGGINVEAPTGVVGTLLDDGLILAVGGELDPYATLSGNGTIEIVGGAGFSPYALAPDSAVTFRLDSNAALQLGTSNTAGDRIIAAGTAVVLLSGGGTDLSTISGFTLGDTFLLQETGSIGGATATLVPAAGGGTLEVSGNGSVLASAVLAGTTAGGFLVTPEVSEYDGQFYASTVQVNPAEADPYGVSPGTGGADSYQWTGPIGGAWGDGGNWTDLTTAGNVVAPGSLDLVTIAGVTPPAGVGTEFMILQGPGDAAGLTISGDVALVGTIAAGGLTLTGTAAGLLIGIGDTLSAGGGLMGGHAGAISVIGAGAALTVSGAISAVGGNTLVASDGGVVHVAALAIAEDLTQGTLDLADDALMVADTLSAIEIGTLDDAARGMLVIDAGATLATSDQVSAASGIVVNGTMVIDGLASTFGTLAGTGTIIANGALTTENTLAAGAALTFIDNKGLSLAGTIAATNTIILAGSSVALTFQSLIDRTTMPVPIQGLAAGDMLDLYSAGSVSAATPIYANGTTTLELQGDGAALLFTGDESTVHFSVTDSPLIDDDYYVTVSAAPCYAAGTRIATTRGEVAVEALAEGDRVITASGAAREIRWIGRRSYDGRFIGGNRDILPIVVRQGALAEGVPSRDLTVSPKHALFLDGVLVPAERLVNGRSVIQRDHVSELTYFHIELDSHDVLLAEATPAESFVDCDSRSMFYNAHEFSTRHPAGLGVSWRFCAERVESGAALEAIRRRIAGRAGLAGCHADDAAAPDLAGGCIDVAAHDLISGWAFCPAQPYTPVEAEILVDGTPVGTAIANEHRPDLAAAGKGRGLCAFTLHLASPLAADRDHEVALRARGGAVLATRMLRAEPASPGPLDGRIDVCDAREVAGWAVDARWPDHPVGLEILVDGVVIGRTRADRYRPDLAAAGFGDCAYRFAWPQPVPAGHEVAVQRAADGAMIAVVCIEPLRPVMAKNSDQMIRLPKGRNAPRNRRNSDRAAS